MRAVSDTRRVYLLGCADNERAVRWTEGLAQELHERDVLIRCAGRSVNQQKVELRPGGQPTARTRLAVRLIEAWPKLQGGNQIAHGSHTLLSTAERLHHPPQARSSNLPPFYVC